MKFLKIIYETKASYIIKNCFNIVRAVVHNIKNDKIAPKGVDENGRVDKSFYEIN